MYIQPNWAREEVPLQIPENYSGTAMDPHSPLHLPPAAAPAANETEAPVSTAPDEAVGSPEQNDPQQPLEASGQQSPDGAPRCSTEGEKSAPKAESVFQSMPPEGARESPREGCECCEPCRSATGRGADCGRAAHIEPGGGALARFPFLSLLLPPKHRGGGAAGTDLALIVGVFLLLSGNKEDELLPLLLLLLLA